MMSSSKGVKIDAGVLLANFRKKHHKDRTDLQKEKRLWQSIEDLEKSLVGLTGKKKDSFICIDKENNRDEDNLMSFFKQTSIEKKKVTKSNKKKQPIINKKKKILNGK